MRLCLLHLACRTIPSGTSLLLHLHSQMKQMLEVSDDTACRADIADIGLKLLRSNG
eukprot:m.68900 g.68900  ORF g.68900 m.68900 type:complete len:56 (+) comp14099_c0_seq6:1635-1802(+)